MHSKQYAATATIAALILVVSAIGCTPAGQAKVPIQGVVTLDGTPLPDGSIYLRRTDGEFFSVDIADGKFSGEAMPGEYRIEISAIREEKPDPTAVAMYGADAPKRQMNYIPAKYNSDSTLSAKVGDSGAGDLKFELSSN
ncbi:hypothetical protein LOC68_11835 [Blastopirellula sp. JC732]|uniref:Carboxypeptidase regulatory-like domain-containing protein n=1 Tax=Blastopirellula sediminis TaxID=2894196 RepID=A0A9X1MP93_9BACT|nr:hypothetical protein [Blastopirellula sediminis]MCC9607618.1 hypothetical protein [Blastopirellula sediminis]MCC9629089.1 hypothetical protein [Blastopirellula sediminis]